MVNVAGQVAEKDLVLRSLTNHSLWPLMKRATLNGLPR